MFEPCPLERHNTCHGDHRHCYCDHLHGYHDYLHGYRGHHRGYHDCLHGDDDDVYDDFLGSSPEIYLMRVSKTIVQQGRVHASVGVGVTLVERRRSDCFKVSQKIVSMKG